MGYSPEEVDRLPWWQRRMFVEQMNAEFAPPNEAGSSGISAPPTPPEPASSTDALARLGMTVQKID